MALGFGSSPTGGRDARPNGIEKNEKFGRGRGERVKVLWAGTVVDVVGRARLVGASWGNEWLVYIMVASE